MRLIPLLLPTLLLAACSQPTTPAADKSGTPSTSAPAAPVTADEDAPRAGLSPDAVDASAQPADDSAPPLTGADGVADTAQSADPATSASQPDAGAQDAGTQAAAPTEGGARARINDLLGNADKYERVFNALQRGVAANDRAAVAALMRYPVRVSMDGKTAKVANAAAFQRDYDRIVTPALAKLIAEQKFDTLFVNWQGVMLGQGEVWLTGICPDNDCAKAEIKVNNIGE